MSIIQFEAKIYDVNGWRILRFPKHASDTLSSRGMVMIKGTINDVFLETTLEPDGAGSHWFPLNDALAEAAQIEVGDTVTLKVQQTDAWKEPDVPLDLMSPLETLNLQTQWDSLTTKARWEWIRWIRFTNNPATRQKRIETLCAMLKKGKRRPCCFDYSRCTETEVSKSGVLIDE